MNVHEHPQFKSYLNLLLKWNAKTNLTAITEPKEIEEKHFLDSLALMPFLKNEARLLDLGTGGGFPGIPLKIVLPELEVVLVDAKNKKISFLQAVIADLGLKKASAHAGRAEDELLQKKLGQFDIVVCRATWELKDLLEAAYPYMKKDAQLIAMKGPKWKEELENSQNILRQLRLECQEIHHYTLPSGLEHTLLIFKQAPVGAS